MNLADPEKIEIERRRPARPDLVVSEIGVREIDETKTGCPAI